MGGREASLLGFDFFSYGSYEIRGEMDGRLREAVSGDGDSPVCWRG